MSSEKSPQPSVSRRDVLRHTARGVTLGILYGMQGSAHPNIVQAGELQEALRGYNDPSRGDAVNSVPEYPARRQVVVEENSRIKAVASSKFAFAVVHAGFVGGELSKWRKQFQGKDPDYMYDGAAEQTIVDIAKGHLGEVSEHQANMARWLSALAVSKRTVLSYIEEPDMYNATTPGERLRPPANAIQVATLTASGQVADTVSYIADNKVHTQHQDIFGLYDSMHKAGIETVYVAGEYTFNPWSKNPACLGGVAGDLLYEGFGVRGISGAVYPPRPQDGIDRDSEIAYALYDNAIPLTQAIEMAKNS